MAKAQKEHEVQKNTADAFTDTGASVAALPSSEQTVAPLPVLADEPGQEDDNSKLVRKITSATLAGKITQAMIPETTGVAAWLGIVYGVCTHIEKDTSTFGDFLRLYGDFIAESHVTGEVSTAGSAILPSLAEAVLKTWVPSEAIGVDGKGPLISPPLQITMEIGIEAGKPEMIEQPDGSHIRKKTYVWTVRPIGAKRQTPAMALRAAIKQRLAAQQPKAIAEG